jgi:hypothetical protein
MADGAAPTSREWHCACGLLDCVVVVRTCSGSSVIPCTAHSRSLTDRAGVTPSPVHHTDTGVLKRVRTVFNMGNHGAPAPLQPTPCVQQAHSTHKPHAMSRRQVGGRTEIMTDAIWSARPTDKGGLDAMSRVVDLLWVRERPEPRKPTGATPVLPASALAVRPSMSSDCRLLGACAPPRRACCRPAGCWLCSAAPPCQHSCLGSSAVQGDFERVAYHCLKRQ